MLFMMCIFSFVLKKWIYLIQVASGASGLFVLQLRSPSPVSSSQHPPIPYHPPGHRPRHSTEKLRKARYTYHVTINICYMVTYGGGAVTLDFFL